jgi:toxin ParE1/3/4
MKRFVLSPAAQADLEDIWDYSAARWSIAQAETYVRAIAAACEALVAGHRNGQRIDDIRPGYMKLLVGSHVLFFRQTEAGDIDIVRILHQRMDVDAHI